MAVVKTLSWAALYIAKDRQQTYYSKWLVSLYYGIHQCWACGQFQVPSLWKERGNVSCLLYCLFLQCPAFNNKLCYIIIVKCNRICLKILSEKKLYFQVFNSLIHFPMAFFFPEKWCLLPPFDFFQHYMSFWCTTLWFNKSICLS